MKSLSNYKIQSSQAGNMIVTAVITLGIMAIITIGAMKGFDKYQDAKVSNEIQELTELRNETVKYGQAIGSPFDATNSAIGTLASLNFWEKKQVTGTGGSTVVSNQWGGLVSVSVGTMNTPGDALDYSYSGVPTYSCKAIGTKVDAIAAKISVNGTPVKTVGQRTNAANLGAACDAASDNATIVYTLSR